MIQGKFLGLTVLFFILSCSHPSTIEENDKQQTVFPVNTWYSNKEYDDFYLEKVQPIFSKRCVTCHGCYEAPCQLNLQSYQGVRRGYHATPIYSMERLKTMPITQMNEVYSLSKWRDLEFLPVVANDEELNQANPAKNWSSSLLMTFIEKGFQYNQPGFPLTDKLATLHNHFKHKNQSQCTATSEQFENHFQGLGKNPWGVTTVDDYFHNTSNEIPAGAGMPFALPALNSDEIVTLTTWMQKGAKGPSAKTMKQLQTPKQPDIIAKWEKFLNTDSAQGRQAARYIYEHTYTAYWHFDESPGEYFKIIRMAKMDDNSEGEIITEFPYQLPKNVNSFFYRLRKITELRVQKKMIVWRVNDQRLNRLQELFLQSWPNQPIPEPQYENSNPFTYFSAIPAWVRARFLIENAETIIGAMVQGAVCVGSGATYAIQDHFWVWFLDPDSDVSVIYPKLGLSSWDILSTGRWHIDEEQMTDKSYTGMFGELWNKVQGLQYDVKAVEKAVQYYERTSENNPLYLKAYERQLRLWLKQQNRQGLEVTDIWDGRGDTAYGDKVNPNAWLNITRHERSATIQRGPEGGAPGSIWVLSFSNFERIYYNLVANYKPYGDLAMKIGTFRIMTYTRLEAEDLAISFLPIEIRQTIRSQYSKGIGWIVNKAFFPQWSMESLENGDEELPPRKTGTPGLKTVYAKMQADLAQQKKNQQEIEVAAAYAVAKSLVKETQNRLQAVSQANYDPNAVDDNQKHWEDNVRETLMHQSKKENGVSYPEYFPSISYLKINTLQGKPWVYSLIADKGYQSNEIIAAESLTRDPDEDRLTLYRGFIGAYPNVFFEINEEQSSSFLSDMKKINSSRDWKHFVEQYGVSRNDTDFWSFFDWIHSYKTKPHPGIDPVMQGIVDVGQYNFF